MSKFDRRKPKLPDVVANDSIRFHEVRVNAEGEALGILSKAAALNAARQRGLDLVLVTENAKPPVCKIVDLNKFLYQKKQKEKEQARKQRESRIEVKEVQFKPNIDTHDFQTKCKHVQRFIEKGNHVKLMVRFRGREMANKQVGFQIISRLMETVEGLGFEAKPSLNGNRLIAIVKGEK
jgi:translation initiation factor IF-3